jgi:quinol-cytochrome oxidoreductase complex cytochrome b subunit
VALFISNGIHLNEYHDYKVKNLLLDKETRKKLTDDSKHFLSRFIVNIVIGVFSIMMTVGLNIIINAVFIGGTANLSGSLLIFIIGFSSFLFITSGMVKSSYDIVLGNGYYCDKVKNK